MISEVPILPTQRGTPGEVFLAFLKLGLTSFGGPIAHLGYFREELVVRRRWLDETGYVDLVALCQFLPGPASSKVGFALGLMRAGPLGALAAWTAFTLPSALLMVMVAFGAAIATGPSAGALVHGLKLVAVAVVAQAVLGMARTLTPDGRRAAIAFGALALASLVGAIGQVAGIAAGAFAGLWLCSGGLEARPKPAGFRISRRFGLLCLAVFALLLVGLPILRLATGFQAIALFDAFYRSGALVFGGGHVVLPLLQAEIVPPGWITENAFLTGYGAAQAVPGPLFTFAAYLGAAIQPWPNGIAGACIALVAIFLPGMLLLLGALPFWDDLAARDSAQAALRGANAAVVGILAAALYSPIWTSAVLTPADFVISAGGFVALTALQAPPWLVVIATVAASLALHWL